MATIDSETTEAVPTGAAGLVATLAAVGSLAALGSILVALGLGDFMAYVAGYRPVHAFSVGYLYLRAFVVTALGWSLLGWAAVRVGRTVLVTRS